MNEDPAILEAKRLIAAKQSKAAVLILFQRIEYLNHELMRLTVPPPSRARRNYAAWMASALILLVAAVIVGTVLIANQEQISDRRAQEQKDASTLLANARLVCNYAAQDNPSIDCEAWVGHVINTNQNKKVILDCAEKYDLDAQEMSRCLERGGVAMP
jgi:hypothetical protein